MAKVNGAKTDKEPAIAPELEATVDEVDIHTEPAESAEVSSDVQDVEECLNALKTLLSAVEKLQKVRQDVGDIKPILNRMLDGEVLTGEELEQLKVGVGGLFRLVRAYSDHQTALSNAQPARTLLDQILKSTGTARSSS